MILFDIQRRTLLFLDNTHFDTDKIINENDGTNKTDKQEISKK